MDEIKLECDKSDSGLCKKDYVVSDDVLRFFCTQLGYDAKDDEKIELNNSKDIRKLYDETFAYEVSMDNKNNELDGDIFRKERVIILTQTIKCLCVFFIEKLSFTNWTHPWAIRGFLMIQ